MLANGGTEGAQERAGARPVPVAEADFAPVVTRPGKVICVGLNYRAHILETGRELPEYPTLFAKFADTLMGPKDDLVLPSVSQRVDWEVELGVVIGRPVYRATPEEAAAAIAGYTVINDVSMRDWQRRTLQWLQGKMFERSTPAGLTSSPGTKLATRPTSRSGAKSTARSCSSRGPRTCCSSRRTSSPTRARRSA